MSRRSILVAAAVAVLFAGWYWFRPELAVIDRPVNEALPDTAGAEILLRGTFHSNAHATRGTATVYRLPDGRVVARFTGFATSNGPDVRIYLVAGADVNNRRDVEHGFVSLGALKGNVGDQNYAVPAEVDLSVYRAISVWCRRFSVNFGAAPLRPPGGRL
jgi:hypothetical protein